MGSDSSDGVTNQLISGFKDLISRGVLLPGCKLPSERDLAPAFGVSRSSLRSALKALEAMGVIIQRVGDGTYLTSNSERILREPLELLILIDGITIEDLIETRLIVEPELAARAAERANVEDLDLMRESLNVLRREKDQALLVRADLAFHEAIFRAARNPVCNRLFSLIHQSMVTSVGTTSRLVDPNHTLTYHEPIFKAIEKRRPTEARQRMTEHLMDARRLLSTVQNKVMRTNLVDDVQPIAGSKSRRTRQSGKTSKAAVDTPPNQR